jgi:hypothetical protein
VARLGECQDQGHDGDQAAGEGTGLRWVPVTGGLVAVVALVLALAETRHPHAGDAA